MRLPPALEVVEEYTFGECGKLKTVEFPAGLEKICVGAFVKSGIENVVLPAALRTVAQAAFCNCKSLKTVKFSEGLEVLGTDEYPDSNSIYSGVFEGSSLERVKLPTTLKKMEYSVFEDCRNLRRVRLPEGLEYVGKRCFSGTGLESVEFPPSLRTIAQGAFYKCEGLRAVKLNEGLEVLGTNEYPKYSGMYCGAFQRSAVERVELPSTLKRIEYSAFEECKNLKNIQLPDRLECIGKWCFHGTRLLTIRVPKKGVEAVPNSFSDCPAESCFTFFNDKIYPKDK